MKRSSSSTPQDFERSRALIENQIENRGIRTKRRKQLPVLRMFVMLEHGIDATAKQYIHFLKQVVRGTKRRNVFLCSQRGADVGQQFCPPAGLLQLGREQ